MPKKRAASEPMTETQRDCMRVRITEVECEEIEAKKKEWSDAGEYPSGAGGKPYPSQVLFTISAKYRVTFSLFMKNGYRYTGPVDVDWFNDAGIEETLSGHSTLPRSNRKSADDYLREVVASDWRESLSVADRLADLEIPFFNLAFSDLRRVNTNSINIFMEVIDE